MRLRLYRDMKAEGWRSMDRYASALEREFSTFPDVVSGSRCQTLRSAFRTGTSEPERRDNPQLSIFSTEPPIKSSRVRMFWRNEVYPRLAKFNQGEVNHVLDHSYAHLLNFLDPRRTVITCHDLIPLEYEKDESLRRRFYEKVLSLKKARLVMADSQSTKKDLIHYLNLDEEKIVVIYLGVDPVFRVLSEGEKGKARQKWRLPDGFLIFSHGNFLPYKNVEGILRVFAQVVQENPSSWLLRVGGFSGEQRSLISRLGMGEKIIEIRRPDDEGLNELYNLSDVFLSPSFKEGFGLTVLQSMACGLPVVVSKGTSLEEVAGPVGIYVDPNDVHQIAQTIRGLVEGYPTFARSPEELVDRSRQFNWRQTAEQTYSLYEGLSLK